ncbi:hypothetical protein V6Z11_A13G169400 [Gossypium hirsutum]
MTHNSLHVDPMTLQSLYHKPNPVFLIHFLSPSHSLITTPQRFYPENRTMKSSPILMAVRSKSNHSILVLDKNTENIDLLFEPLSCISIDIPATLFSKAFNFPDCSQKQCD